MSYCVKKGKDTIIFATEEYLSSPSSIQLQPDDPKELDTSNQGAILPNGEINWDCPCLGNMPNGPCGPSFRQSFQCWVDNKDDETNFAEKCFTLFTNWEKCLSQHRSIYRPEEENENNKTVEGSKSTSSVGSAES